MNTSKNTASFAPPFSFGKGAIQWLMVGILVLKTIQRQNQQRKVASFSDYPFLAFLGFTLLGIPADLLAQSLVSPPPASILLLRYDWESNPTINKQPIPRKGEVNPTFFRQYTHKIEHFYDLNENLRVLELYHQSVYLTDNEALARYSQIYLPLQEGELLKLKARFISAEGQVKELPFEAIKELQFEASQAMKVFAIEGAELGGELEFFYLIERENMVCGYHQIPENAVIENYTFEIISPQEVVFEAKAYQQFPSITAFYDELENKNILQAQARHLQTQHLDFAALPRVHHKISHYADMQAQSIFTWNDLSTSIVKHVYLEREGENKAHLRDLLQQILPTEAQNRQKGSLPIAIRSIENYIKTYIRKEERYENEYSHLAYILEQGVANELGLVRLFALLLEEAKIDYRLVMTSDKRFYELDEHFPSWDFLQHYLFYFPQEDAFLSPTEPHFRYGLVPAYLTGQKGIFMQKVAMGQNWAGRSFVQLIPHTDKNLVRSLYQVSFDKKNQTTHLNLKCQLVGYKAADLQAQYAQSDTPEKYIARHFEIATQNRQTDILHISQVNTFASTYFQATDSFSIEGALHSPSLLEQASDTYLFNVGSLLQMQAQQPDKLYPESFYTVIEFEIPENYAIRNIEDLRKNVWAVEKDRMQCLFRTDFIAIGRKIRLEIQEYYKADVSERERNRIYEAARSFENTVLVFKKTK
ncbi:DUF3857 domain-containing protein [Hugenholtzia roseola]|uniref:DUF3857 domain-containing protein n=1 Tax=Hugenholtzia roseola TaxID=1002 RepID=UPI0004190B2E|nr:DUF3857 domain-containing protein [Hugenholtzia roseola]